MWTTTTGHAIHPTDVANVRASPMTITLAADLGSTRIKVGLISVTGELLDVISLPAPPIKVIGEAAEIDPEHWWSAFCQGASILIKRASAPIAAIAVTGPTRTQVLVDAETRPLIPAIAWSDTRATALTETLRQALPPDHPEAAEFNAFHPLARLAWINANRPDVLARAHAVIEPKDFIVARLTGAIVSDAVSLARLVAAANPGPSGSNLFDALGLPLRLLPPMHRPERVAGHVRVGIAVIGGLAGIPVLTGSNDTWTAVLGLGALRPSYAYAISGTTEVFGAMATHPGAAEGLMTVEWGDGLYQVGGPGQNGADTLDWLMRLVKPDTAPASLEGLEALLAKPRHPQPALFLPYLRGERVPFWDPALRGAFLGLTREHKAGDLAWAVLEGLALLNRTVLERGESAIGTTMAEVRLGGGLSRSAEVAQIKADVLGRDVVTSVSDEAGLVGCGLLAAFGVHGAASLSEVQERVPIGQRYAPDPARRTFYDSLFSAFRQAHDAVAPLSRTLAKLSVARG